MSDNLVERLASDIDDIYEAYCLGNIGDEVLRREVIAALRAQLPDGEAASLLDGAHSWINAAPHGDNCYLQDDGGEFDSCFCGRDSILLAIEGYLYAHPAPSATSSQAGDGAAEPIARVAGYYGGRCVIEPLSAAVLPSGMALYAAAVDAVDAWRPIETAPKDGTEILVWKSHAVLPIIARFDAQYDEFEDEHRTHIYHLTHWMPLPPAPTGAASEGGGV